MSHQIVPAERRAEIRALTSFRAWAALFVFAHHELVHKVLVEMGDDSTPFLQALMHEGRVGVAMFFVLSGFLLTLRYHGRVGRGDMKGYLIKRVARIWPLYLAVLGLLFAFDLYKGEVEWGPYVVYLTLTQAFFDDLRFRGINTAWSLTVEECFYLLLPGLLAAATWAWGARRSLAANLARVAIILAAVTALLHGVGVALERQELVGVFGFFGPSRDWIPYTIFGRFLDFAVGILLGLAYLKGSNALLARPRTCDALIVAAIALIVFCCSQIFYHDERHAASLEVYHVGNVLGSAAIIYALCAPGSWIARINSHRWLVYLGRISFAFYLVHMAKFLLPIYRRIGWLELPAVVEGAFCYGVATLLAVVLYELVERPMQRRVLGWGGIARPATPPDDVGEVGRATEAAAALHPTRAT